MAEARRENDEVEADEGLGEMGKWALVREKDGEESWGHLRAGRETKRGGGGNRQDRRKMVWEKGEYWRTKFKNGKMSGIGCRGRIRDGQRTKLGGEGKR